MTRIDFHILPTADEADTFSYVARLAQKALNKDHQVLIAVGSESEKQAISKALWSYRPDSFLAHTDIAHKTYPLQISAQPDCGEHHDVLINLCAESPAYFSRFKRVFEVVSQDNSRLHASRQRYRAYQDNGYPIERHDLRSRG
jgi:DNA polymerase-3 subunit chi